MTPNNGQRVYLSTDSEHFPGEYVYVVDRAEGEEYDICASHTKYGDIASEVQWVKSKWAMVVDSGNQPVDANPPKRRGRKPGSKSIKREAVPSAKTPEPIVAKPTESVVAVSITAMAYPFPLDNQQIATLNLPSPLTRRDAIRLGQFNNALVIEPEDQ